MHVLWAAVAAGVAAAPGASQVVIGGKPYVRLESRARTREAMLGQLTGVDVSWGAWSVLAPIDHPAGAGRIEQAYPPEDELAKMGAGGPGPDLGAAYEGKGGKRIGWRPIEPKPDIGGLGGVLPLDLAEGLSAAEKDKAVGYLYRQVTAQRACEFAVSMGSDDGMRLWLNGELLVSDASERPLDPEAHRVTLRLKPGVNHVFVKVSQGAGEWQFQMSEHRDLDPVAEAALDWQLDEDFPDAESRFYRIATVPHASSVSLEVGGIDLWPEPGGGPGRPILCTRRGEVFIVENAYELPPLNARFRLFAAGLQEPLGLRIRPSAAASGGATSIVMAQRSELTEAIDTSGSGVADVFRTVCDRWQISGNYHEYAFGPKYDREGNAWVNLNLAHTGGETVMGTTIPTRGWSVKIDGRGNMIKVADGLRSPDGIGMGPDGEMFYTDNQGDYVATNKLCHLKQGAFYGHQASLKFREGYGANWRADGKPVPEITWPAVWFPYKKMGQSASDILLDDTGGAFGPFAGQVFVGEQTYAEVYRVFLEKVAGPDGAAEYQGACFPFRKGFCSGVHRMTFAPADASGRASMWVGMTDRGWGSTGPKRDGLQRLVWTGRRPFEIKEMRIQPDGFVLEFTLDLGADAAEAAHYRMTSYTYQYHPDYGSPEVDQREVAIMGVEAVGPRAVRLRVDGLRSGGMGYVHELHVKDLAAAPDPNGVREPLLHDAAYYTVQRIPVSAAGRSAPR
jgi:hypothetical protein